MSSFTSSSAAANSYIEKKLQCPYVPTHTLIPMRFANHLNKCRRNIRGDKTSPFHRNAMETEICPFDSTHHIHKSRMDHHINDECDRKKIVVNFAYRTDHSEEIPEWKRMTSDHDRIDKPVGNADEEEDWDEDPPVAPYNPLEKLRDNTEILVNPQGLTTSQRQRFRTSRRLKNAGAEEVPDIDQFWKPVIAESGEVYQKPKDQPNPSSNPNPLKEKESLPRYPSKTPFQGRGRAERVLAARGQPAPPPATNAWTRMPGRGQPTGQMPQMPRGRGFGRGFGRGTTPNATAPPPGFAKLSINDDESVYDDDEEDDDFPAL